MLLYFHCIAIYASHYDEGVSSIELRADMS